MEREDTATDKIFPYLYDVIFLLSIKSWSNRFNINMVYPGIFKVPVKFCREFMTIVSSNGVDSKM